MSQESSPNFSLTTMSQGLDSSPSTSQVLLTPHALQVLENFSARYEKLVEEITETPLVILVWGPADPQNQVYQKRIQIRNTLRQMGHAAVFSEELVDRAANFPSLKAIEYAQAKNADLVVVLQASSGSIGEVHDMTPLDAIKRKMLIFVDSIAIGGYSWQSVLLPLKEQYGNVETYKSPEDIQQCHLLGKVLSKVKRMQEAKFWSREYALENR